MTAALERLIDQVMHLRDQALAFESAHQHLLEQVAEHYRNSARNLMHYLALRQRDLRDLQNELAALGLSSLGRSESHTLHTLHGVLRALHCLAGHSVDLDDTIVPVTFRTGALLLDEHTHRLFGEAAGKRPVRIMVTMPSEAARNPELVRNLLAAGMDIMRINCAHDTPEDWLRMIANLREAERAVGRTCKVYADLAGPKLRTGPLPPIFVRKVRPKRNLRGEVIEPARVWFAASTEAALPDDAPIIPIEGNLLRKARKGDVIYLRDARGRKRRLVVETRRRGLLGVSFDRTVYFETGTPLRLRRGDAWLPAEGSIGALPPQYEPLVLNVGDKLVLTRNDQLGQPARRSRIGALLEPARIGCTLGEAFDAVQPEQPIWFDDGKIGGRVLSNNGREIAVEITFARPGGSKLGAEKGINLPNTDLSAIPALTEKDREDLAVLAHHVDMVGLSFVRQPEDVTMLSEALKQLRAQHVAVVLKIETRCAFENLPRLLLAGMQMHSLGVMVARGDLAVEVGFDRLAEVQEEILWICEAAHIPVIWATQVLESMAKSGAPSRAEVSDAVMSGRAECVMLNKGPYIVEATRFLSNVLERMAAHQSKKRSRLRRLSIARL